MGAFADGGYLPMRAFADEGYSPMGAFADKCKNVFLPKAKKHSHSRESGNLPVFLTVLGMRCRKTVRDSGRFPLSREWKGGREWKRGREWKGEREWKRGREWEREGSGNVR